jgi:sulfite dehydrogenase (quinone) subunit SoeC
MHPALSVIFFTTLSGAGYGLLAWVGLSTALLALRGALEPGLSWLQLSGLALGILLSTAGLASSLFHLGQPQRAWRALSQWRSSWLSREGVMALVTPAPALAMAALLLWAEPGAARQGGLAIAGLLLCVLALGTVACTAMIYASLKPIPAWRHPLVVPVYLVFALLTGFGLMLVLVSALPESPAPLLPLAAMAMFGTALAALKWRYWYQIDRTGLPASRGDALGLPGRAATVFERPHTEANYITREMAFTVARRHARALRMLAVAALVAAPLLALALAACGLSSPLAALVLATTATLGAAFVERWLFFAEARHVVTLYY